MQTQEQISLLELEYRAKIKEEAARSETEIDAVDVENS